MISLENEKPLEAYKIIRNELGKFDKMLLEKQEIIILTKTDLVGEKQIKKAKKELSKVGENIYQVSVINDKEIKEFSDSLSTILKKS